LNGLEEVLDCLLLCAMAVYQILGCAAQNDLASHTDSGILLESNG
jgi:hypothetical protein